MSKQVPMTIPADERKEKLSAPQRAMLRHIDRCTGEYDGFAPHYSGEWRTMYSLERLGLAKFDAAGECGDGCERAGECPHPVWIYTLTDEGRRWIESQERAA